LEFNIAKAKMTEELMETLAKLYEKSSTSNKVFLMKHLFNMKMAEGGYVANHLNDDVISVILSEETHRKTSSGSTFGSALDTKSRQND
jgi:hypothetical protein